MLVQRADVGASRPASWSLEWRRYRRAVRTERVEVLSLTRCRELLPPGSTLTDAELVEVVDRLYQLAEVAYSCAKPEPKTAIRPPTKILDFSVDHD